MFVVRRSFVLRSSRRGRSGRNLNPPYLGVKSKSKANRNRQQEKKSSSKQTSPIDLIHKRHINYPSNQAPPDKIPNLANQTDNPSAFQMPSKSCKYLMQQFLTWPITYRFHAIVCSFVGCNHELIQRAAAVAAASPLPERTPPQIKLEPFFVQIGQSEKRGNHNHGIVYNKVRMCVRTYLLPPPQSLNKRTKFQPNPKQEKKCQMTSPPSFNLVVISNGISQSKKRRTLEPFEDFPAFFGAWACRLLQAKEGGSRQPYFVVFLPVVLGYMVCNVLEVSSSLSLLRCRVVR